jgi:alkanesulfonate monooxygenase SsuD/methylene tetrahydromethanopterin reductase-like flavin-dependent oxidoreductase (luciferase family)
VDDPAQPDLGTPEQVIEALPALYDAGMTYAICYFPQAVTDPSGVELFQREVIPALA